MNREELKNQALLEKISNLVTQYENSIADLRVEVTFLNAELEGYRNAQPAQGGEETLDEALEEDSATGE